MNVERALTFTPAAIITEAAVCLAACRPIGVSSEPLPAEAVLRFARELLGEPEAVGARGVEPAVSSLTAE